MKKEFFLAFAKAALPEFDWALSEMEKSGGWLNIPDDTVQRIQNIDLHWWDAYASEERFKHYQALMVLDSETLKNIKTKADLDTLNQQLTSEYFELLTSDFIHDDASIPEKQQADILEDLNNSLEELSEDELKQYWQRVAFFWVGVAITFFNTLSLMVHGRSLIHLVSAAQDGDDEAYTLAVQVDRTVLFLPYFQQRLLRAQLARDSSFLDSLAYRIKNPILKGKIRRRRLWLVFALLDSEGYLDSLSGPELMEFCEQVGVYGDEYGIGSLSALRKRKSEYYENRGTRKYF